MKPKSNKACKDLLFESFTKVMPDSELIPYIQFHQYVTSIENYEPFWDLVGSKTANFSLEDYQNLFRIMLKLGELEIKGHN